MHRLRSCIIQLDLALRIPSRGVDACDHRVGSREQGASVVEYVGLGAVSAMLVSGIAAAFDGHAGDRIATAIVRRIIEVISGSGS